MGRRKIEMKLVKDSNSRQVTFSKRRNGVFKKANELATLCAIQIAIIVFSPGGKAFSFGHSSVESVTDRYLHDQKKPVKANAEPSSKTSSSRVHGGQQSGKAARLSWKLNELQNELNEEKDFGEILKERISINDLDYEQLVEMKQKLEELKSEIELRKTELEVCDALLLLSEGVVKFEI